jgi:hypothetical protein
VVSRVKEVYHMPVLAAPEQAREASGRHGSLSRRSRVLPQMPKDAKGSAKSQADLEKILRDLNINMGGKGPGFGE